MFKELEEKFKKIKEFFAEELKSLRSGRAQPSLVENVLVEAYGSRQPLKRLAAITVADPRTIAIEPWDKSLLKEIEKGIASSTLNLSPGADSGILRLKLPEPTEENRRQTVKQLKEKLEQSRVTARKARDEAKKVIEIQARSGALTEDDKYQAIEELDKKTKTAISVLEELADKKEKEILSI